MEQFLWQAAGVAVTAIFALAVICWVINSILKGLIGAFFRW